jgi:hypothetical protein
MRRAAVCQISRKGAQFRSIQRETLAEKYFLCSDFRLICGQLRRRNVCTGSSGGFHGLRTDWDWCRKGFGRASVKTFSTALSFSCFFTHRIHPEATASVRFRRK